MSPRKFALRAKSQTVPACDRAIADSACLGCALARAATPCNPNQFLAQPECHILNERRNGFADIPFMIIDVADFKVSMANLATGIRVPVQSIRCYELSHRQSHPCSGKEFTCPMAAVVKTKKPVATRHTHYNSSGEQQKFDVHAHPVFDRNGKVIQIIEYSIKADAVNSNRNRLDSLTDLAQDLTKTAPDCVLSLVRTLSGRIGRIEPDYVELLAKCLDSDLPQPRDPALRKRIECLKPDELSICKLMWYDLSSREISLMSGKDVSQINNKRRRIRQKLGLTQTPVNLNHYLQTRW